MPDDRIHIRLHLPPYPCQRAQVSRGVAYYKPAYRNWKRQAAQECGAAWTGKETLQWIKKLSMQFYGWDRRYDLSNLFKAVEDAMVKAGIMRDDNLTVIQHIESAWEKAPTKEAQYIDIFLEV